MTNEKYTAGSITIMKEDEDGKPLAGAEFMLFGPKTDKKTTDNNGVAEFTGLEAGKYSIIEKLPRRVTEDMTEPLPWK